MDYTQKAKLPTVFVLCQRLNNNENLPPTPQPKKKPHKKFNIYYRPPMNIDLSLFYLIIILLNGVIGLVKFIIAVCVAVLLIKLTTTQ